MKPASPVVPGFHVNEIVWDSTDPDVEPLPAVMVSEGNVVLTRWELSDEDRERIAEGQAIYLWVSTGGDPLQPVTMGVYRPEELMDDNTDDDTEETVEEEWPDVVGS